MTDLGPNPLDTLLSGGLRFLVELIAWVAGPWAAGRWLGVWAGAPALVVLMALPSVFSVPGDKNQVVVAVSGPLRLALEIGLGVVAVVAAWYVWPTIVAVASTITVLLAQVTGWRRSRWLLQGAPRFE
ncbi:MAG: hypothetical protein V3R84_10485 [Acidimicrobiia bacterium]